jgi:hypothetical protein
MRHYPQKSQECPGRVKVSYGLASIYLRGIGQNIESQALKSKILPNKDLAPAENV